MSTIVNRGSPLKAYVFRNYNLLPGVHSHYLGGCHHHLWQAIRATSAAPGYFQEFSLGNDLHQVSIIRSNSVVVVVALIMTGLMTESYNFTLKYLLSVFVTEKGKLI